MSSYMGFAYIISILRVRPIRINEIYTCHEKTLTVREKHKKSYYFELMSLNMHVDIFLIMWIFDVFLSRFFLSKAPIQLLMP